MRIAAMILLSSVSVLALAGERATADRDGWQAALTATFSTAALPGAGFSFQYDGKTAGPAFAAEWTRDDRGPTDDLVLKHESGLVVVRSMRVLGDFNAIEYTLRFRNVSDRALPAISALRPLDIAFDPRMIEGTCVIASGGGTADHNFPPNNFSIRKTCVASTNPVGAYVEVTTEGGRSSNRDLPFFFIQNDARQSGLFVAFGWSGQWKAAVEANRLKRVLKVYGSIPDIQVSLQPGEEIQGPTILVGSYEGAVQDGINRLRRLVYEVYAPRLNGERFLPVVTYDHWAMDIEHRFDEALLRKLADAAAAMGQEYFLLDAGWYAGTNDENGFSAGLGNWRQIDRAKFPNGLGAFSDHVRSRKLGFGLWFEPERVARNSALAKEHPDWILWNHAEEPEGSFNSMVSSGHGLLDFGRPEVQQWAREMMDHYIRKYAVRYIRYDFNMDPLPYWSAHDAPDRRGITQLRHIHGVYAVIDWIRERHPETILEGCASGAFGTAGRVDLWPEELRRKALLHVEVYKKLRRYLVNDYYPLSEQPRSVESWSGWQFHDPGRWIGIRRDLSGEDAGRLA